ncbi:unnamed protein product, partial [Polarella glacialis]
MHAVLEQWLPNCLCVSAKGADRTALQKASSRLLVVWLLLQVLVRDGNGDATSDDGPEVSMPVACSCQASPGAGRDWERLRLAAWKAFTPDLPVRVTDRNDPVNGWLSSFPCSDLQGSYRGVNALSDCAPGVMMLHVICAQQLLLQLRYTEAQEQLVEALQALPFAERCLDTSGGGEQRWPLSTLDMNTNYVRFYRAVSYYVPTVEILNDLLWRPTWSCRSNADCAAIGQVCDGQKCAALGPGCTASSAVCPDGLRCTSLHAPGGSQCTLELSSLCIVDSALQAFHPNSACLHGNSYPGMIKACSEMGQTLYALQWSSIDFRSSALADNRPSDAFMLPVTLRLKSPWHMLHSLVPAFAQAEMDSRYGLRGQQGEFDLILVDQDLNKDTHIWEKVLGEFDKSIGGLDFLLKLISRRPYELLANIKGPRCYERVIWGHELMLYSGGGWTNETHMAGFTSAARDFAGAWNRGGSSGHVRSSDAPTLLLVERRNTSAWGRWIDNFGAVQRAADDWAAEHPELLGGVRTVDVADLRFVDQLRLAA